MESMTEERVKATFDVRELTYYLDGGEKFTKVKDNCRSLLCLEPEKLVVIALYQIKH